MERRKRPSIFDLMERMLEEPFREIEERMRRFPRRLEKLEDWFRDPFEQMIREFEERIPPEFIKEEETPSGKVKRYGPFVYGFTYTQEPGKLPEFKEFGNIRPTLRGIEPFREREPLVDVIEKKDSYEIVAELPGVEKENIKLDATESSLEIRATNERKFYKEISFDSPIDPSTATTDYRNGVLSIQIKKKERKRTPINI